MTNCKIDSIGWKSMKKETGVDSVTFYALVVDDDNPDFQFSLKLTFFEVLNYAKKYYVVINNFLEHYPVSDDTLLRESKLIKELKVCAFNIRQLALMVFEELFDLEKESEKAVVMTPEELCELKEIVRPVDRSKPPKIRREVICDEVNILMTESIFNAVLEKYPVLNSITDGSQQLNSIVCDSYYYDVVEPIANLIYMAEKQCGLSYRNAIGPAAGVGGD
jgi:hypothetical protein